MTDMTREEDDGPLEQLFLASIVSKVLVSARKAMVERVEGHFDNLVELVEYHPVFSSPIFPTFFIKQLKLHFHNLFYLSLLVYFYQTVIKAQCKLEIQKCYVPTITLFNIVTDNILVISFKSLLRSNVGVSQFILA
jgi:hypothetical protein